MKVRVITDAAALWQGIEDWSDLARWAAEPNPMWEPYFLLPSLRHLEPGKWKAWVVERKAGGWVGLLVQRARLGREANLLGLMESWQHGHSFLATPLIRKGEEKEFWRTLLRAWEKGEGGGRLWRWEGMALDGPVGRGLSEALAERGQRHWVAGSWERGLLPLNETWDTYAKTVLSSHRRRRLQKLEQKLAAHGEVQFEVRERGTELEPWVETFLALEHGGWKGEERTSLRSNPEHELFFRALVHQAEMEGKLRFSRLTVDGHTVAALCDLVSGRAAFSFKVATDDRLREGGPGLVLDRYSVEHYLTEKALQWVDSCAAPDQAAVNTLWRERRVLGTVYVAQRSLAGVLTLEALRGASRFKAWRQRKKSPAESAASAPQTEVSTEAPCKLRQRETTLR